MYGELGTAKYEVLRRRRRSWDENIHRICFVGRFSTALMMRLGLIFIIIHFIESVITWEEK